MLDIYPKWFKNCISICFIFNILFDEQNTVSLVQKSIELFKDLVDCKYALTLVKKVNHI